METREQMFNVRDELQHLSVEEIRKHQPKNGFAVCVFNVLGDLNVGTILRSSVLFGADKFYVAGRNKLDRRSMVGAQNYIDIIKLDNYDLSNDTIDVSSTFDTIRKDGYQVVCCEIGGERSDDVDWKYYSKPCFIFGNEGIGLPEEAILNSDVVTTIPQLGVMRSHNVSVASGIIMYEFMRGK